MAWTMVHARKRVGSGPVGAAVLGVVSGTALLGGPMSAQELGGPHLELPQVIEREDSRHTLLLIPCARCGAASRDRFIESNAERGLTDVEPFRFGEVVRRGVGSRDIVLMPCLGCDASSWSEFMERNERRYRMVAVTWPGMGTTPLPAVVDDPEGTPYFDFLVGALELLIEREELDRPVLVGHSAAAVAAVRFAAERPDLVSGVVNVDAVIANTTTFGFDADRRRAWADAEMAEVLATYDDEAWRRLNAAPASMTPERGAFYEAMWLTPPRANVFAYWRDWLRTDAGVLLPRLPVPLLALHALPSDTARAATKRAELQAAYARAPLPERARVVFVANSGHTIWEYQPAAFDAALADFVLGSVVGGS